MEHAFAEGVSEDIVKNGFKRCGLYPFDPNAVDYSKCMSERDLPVPPQDVIPESGQWSALKCIEGMLKPGRLVHFFGQTANNTWRGDEEARELFEMWSKLKDCVSKKPDAVPDHNLSAAVTVEEIPPAEPQPLPGPSFIPPTPFGEDVHWPEGDGLLYRGERFPLATTSKEWMVCHKKEAEKMEKEERKRKRAEKPRRAPPAKRAKK